MTGMDAWSIVAPILSSHMNNIPHVQNGKHVVLNALDEAYVVVYGALSEHDKRIVSVTERETDV